MKKSLLLLGAGVMLLTSCSNDELVNPVANTGKDLQPIGFAVSRANMGRAEGNYSKLETVSYDFGVWAYKSDDSYSQTESSVGSDGFGDDVVMKDYLVGYWNKTNGYDTNGVDLPTEWYYAGLGSTEFDGSKFKGNVNVQKDANTSVNGIQYLKYWDLAKTYVNFYACAPYTAASSFDAKSMKMTFNEISESKSDYMYGCAAVKSANGANGDYVQIPFKRLSAQIRFAFYSGLEGYDVEIIDFEKESEDRTVAKGIIAVPAVQNGAFISKATNANGYIIKATPVVTFQNDGSAIVEFTKMTRGTENIECPLYFTPNKTYAALTAADIAGNAKWSYTDDPYWLDKPILGSSKEKGQLIYGGLRRVIPHGDKENCGFTVNVSFKLTAKDTKEVLYVYGARVYVGKEFTKWEPNKLYTYVFKITNNVPGTTSTPQEPDVTPTDPALIPIIFDNATVEDIDFEEIVYPGTGADEAFVL